MLNNLLTSGTTLARGVIETVNYHEDRDPSMTFRVRLTTGENVSGSSNGIQDNVPMMMPVFGPTYVGTAPTATPPTGMYGVPQVGTQVILMKDSAGWVILGCMSGPAKTSDARDNRLLGRSYNPGLEQAEPKTDKVIPGLKLKWLFGLAPGDIVVGRGEGRFKLCSEGAIVAASPTNLTMYKPDGERIDRSLNYEVRAIGYMKKHAYEFGTGFEAWSATDSGAPPLDGSACTTEIFEVDPHPTNFTPFLIEQKGFVSPLAADSARQAIDLETPKLDVLAAKTKGHVISRVAVLKQVAKDLPGTLGGEAKRTHYSLYDHQVWNDGSYFISAGNKAKAPGNRIFDSEIEYDALTQEWTLRVGRVTVTIDGVGQSVEVASGTSTVTVDPRSIKASAGTATVALSQDAVSVELGAAKVAMTPLDITLSAVNVKIAGMLTVQGNVTATGDVFALQGSKSLALHTHVSNLPGVPTSPPI